MVDAPKAGVEVAPKAGAGAPKSPVLGWGAAVPKGFAAPNNPPPVVVEVWPKPNPDAVVVAPKPAGLLPKRLVEPAVEVAPNAEVVVLINNLRSKASQII